MERILMIALCLVLAVPAHAQQTKEELRLMLQQKPEVLPPPRDCVRTARGDLIPIPRSDGVDVDMTACNQPPSPQKKRENLNIFQLNK